jgi:hypothetical protein
MGARDARGAEFGSHVGNQTAGLKTPQTSHPFCDGLPTGKLNGG